MSRRQIERIVTPPAPHYVGDGFRVHHFIPGALGLSMQRMDPFIMMDYNAPFYFSPSKQARGVGVHPHRGFETVTLAYQGKVAHHDSSGGGGVIGEGDVQWMTAASGVLHKEYHEEQFSAEGGIFQMVQLWVNLPAAHKMSPPKYQALENKQFGRYALDELGSVVEVVAGAYRDAKGAASTFTPIHLLNVRLVDQASADFDFPAHYTTAVLALEGNIRINESQDVPVNHFALMDHSGESFRVQAQGPAKILVLSGEPIGEPIAAHGPFVMNTREELIQAFRDFENGDFGYLA